MRKFGLGFLIALALLFLAVTLARRPPSAGDRGATSDPVTTAERDSVLRFWETYRRATAHRIAGRIDEAAREYERALRLDAEHEDALYYLGNVRLELGQFGAAERAWRRLLEVNPASARAHSQLGLLYSCIEAAEQVDFDRAEAEFQRALALNKEETGPLLQLGQIALFRGDLVAARRYFDAVIGSNYSSVAAHFFKGYIVWKEGDRPTASQLFAEAVRYARPAQPVQGVPGEGDTRDGSGPMVKSSTPCRWAGTLLADLETVELGDSTRAADAKFRQLEEILVRRRQAKSD